MPRPRRLCCGPAAAVFSAPHLPPPPDVNPSPKHRAILSPQGSHLLPALPPWSHARLASPGWEEGAWMLSADPPPDPGLPGMLQGSEPDTKSHGSHLRGRLGVLRGCPFCLPHTPFRGPAEEPAVHTALPRGVLLESILSRALAFQLLKGSGPPSPPSSAGSSSLPGAPPSCFTGRAWPLHCRPASGGRSAGGRDGACGGEPRVGGLLSLAPYPHRAWCPASSGPTAHLFCALVTYESPPPRLPPAISLTQTLPGGAPC